MMNIDDLNVSKKWKARFQFYRELGADDLGRDEIIKTEKFKKLRLRDKYRITGGNIWAFVGGCFYYFVKGMWLKGGIFFSASLVWISLLSLIEFFSGFEMKSMWYWMPISIACMLYANLDFYRKEMCGEKMWSNWPPFFHGKSGIIKICVTAVIVQVLSIVFIVQHTHYSINAENDKAAIRFTCGIDRVYVTEKELSSFGEDAVCAQL